MRRIMETKGKILEMLSVKSKTLTDISRELGLAPSTVSQHLAELQSAGAIERVDNPHIRKWKYYTLAKDLISGVVSRERWDYRQMGQYYERFRQIGGQMAPNH